MTNNSYRISVSNDRPNRLAICERVGRVAFSGTRAVIVDVLGASLDEAINKLVAFDVSRGDVRVFSNQATIRPAHYADAS